MIGAILGAVIAMAPAPSEKAVQLMLWLANAGPHDLVYELGCAEAQISIAAVRRFGARAVCVEGDPAAAIERRENARRAGVAARIRFVEEDPATADLRDATVVILVLAPAASRKLGARLRQELRPGTRVVSYRHDLGDWPPQHTAHVGEQPLHLWVVPR